MTTQKVVPKLYVFLGPMKESNGKHNYTVMLHRGDIMEGITFYRSEYPDRARYEADQLRHLIGELEEKPFILDYDTDAHSGYVNPHKTPQELLQEKYDALLARSKETLRVIGLANQGSSAYNEAVQALYDHLSTAS